MLSGLARANLAASISRTSKPVCNRLSVALDINLCGNPEMTMATSYSIGKHFEAFIESLIATGRYSTASEIIRDGLRLIEEREQDREAKLEWVRAAIQEGLHGRRAE